MKERVAEIVAAYLERNSVAPGQLPALIVSVKEHSPGLGKSHPHRLRRRTGIGDYLRSTGSASLPLQKLVDALPHRRPRSIRRSRFGCNRAGHAFVFSG